MKTSVLSLALVTIAACNQSDVTVDPNDPLDTLIAESAICPTPNAVFDQAHPGFTCPNGPLTFTGVEAPDLGGGVEACTEGANATGSVFGAPGKGGGYVGSTQHCTGGTPAYWELSEYDEAGTPTNMVDHYTWPGDATPCDITDNGASARFDYPFIGGKQKVKCQAVMNTNRGPVFNFYVNNSTICHAWLSAQCTTLSDTALIPAGTFNMGSPTNEYCRVSGPGYGEDLHQVTLTHSYNMFRTETTQGQFQSVMGYNPSTHTSCGADCPVENVSWHESIAYCNALSTAQSYTTCYTCTGTGKNTSCSLKSAYTGSNFYTCPGYRLPTDAEWERAARGGTSTAFYNGDVDAGVTCSSCSQTESHLSPTAWYCKNAGGGPHRVARTGGVPGTSDANAYGLYDMSGNVFEWAQDKYKAALTGPVTDPLLNPSGADKKVFRGGSYDGTYYPGPQYQRAAFRNKATPTIGFPDQGFRCVRSNL